MSVMTAMPLKHVSLSSVREGGRDLSPERCAVSCVLFPTRADSERAGRGP